MKQLIKSKISILLLLLLAITGCEKTDIINRNNNESANILTFKGVLMSNQTVEYNSTVDEAAGTVFINVDYFISDTEDIVPDLTQMKLTASLPVSATLTPSIQGVHDLTKPLSVTLIREDETRTELQIQARRVKSDKKDIKEFTISNLPNVRTVVKEEASGKSKIIIYRLGDPGMFIDAIPAITLSPRATVSPAPGTKVDLSIPTTFTVTAHDGSTKEYVTSLETPEFVDTGVGIINKLFYLRGKVEMGDDMKLDANNNVTITCVGDELILSNKSSGFLRYNRFTGKRLEKTVNIGSEVDGVSGIIFAIDTDDDGKLIATNFVRTNTAGGVFKIFKWDNLEMPPTLVYSVSIDDPSLAPLKTNLNGTSGNQASELGRQIDIKGSIDGDAQILLPVGGGIAAYTGRGDNRILRYKVTDGKVVNGATPELITAPCSFGWRAKAIPMTTEDNTPILLASQDHYRLNYFINSDRSVTSFAPRGGFWGGWANNNWAGDLKGMDYIEFNGLKMMAIQNGLYSSGIDSNNRLFVFDITNPSAQVLNATPILDARILYGANEWGMTSNIWGLTGVANTNKTGSVCFGRSADGTAVQVYMFVTNHGMIAYELTKFKP